MMMRERAGKKERGVILKWSYVFIILTLIGAYYQYHKYQQGMRKACAAQQELLTDLLTAAEDFNFRPWTEEDHQSMFELNKQAPWDSATIPDDDVRNEEFGYVIEKEDSQIIGFLAYEWTKTAGKEEETGKTDEEDDVGQTDGADEVDEQSGDNDPKDDEEEQGEQREQCAPDDGNSDSSSMDLAGRLARATVPVHRMGQNRRAEIYDAKNEGVPPNVELRTEAFDPNINWFIFDEEPKGKLEADTVVYIAKLLIHEDYREKGLGQKVMQKFLSKFPEKTKFALHCTEKNLRFYQKMGFEQKGKMDWTYDGEDAGEVAYELHRY